MTALSADMTAIPSRQEEMYKLLNRTVWEKLTAYAEERIRTIAFSTNPDEFTLEKTREKLLELHTMMLRQGYTTIKSHRAAMNQGEQMTYCPACKHNFNTEAYHPLSRCKFQPRELSEKTKEWFDRKWREANAKTPEKIPFVYPMYQSGQSQEEQPSKKQRHI